MPLDEPRMFLHSIDHCHSHISSIFVGRLNFVMAMFYMFSMNILANAGDNGEFMGSPSVCAYRFSLKVNIVDYRHSEHSSIRYNANSCVRCVNFASII